MWEGLQARMDAQRVQGFAEVVAVNVAVAVAVAVVVNYRISAWHGDEVTSDGAK